jgi:hypothetical protein
MQAAELSGMAGVDFFLGILGDVVAIGKDGPGIMGIQVEEVESLDPDEIVGRGRAPAIHTHRLVAIR